MKWTARNNWGRYYINGIGDIVKITADKETLLADLSHSIGQLQSWKKADKNKTNFVAIYSGLIAALTTVLIGLAAYIESYATEFQVAALVTSSSLTVVTAWDRLFKHKDLWMIQATTLNKLYELRNDINHMEKSGKLSPDVVDKFYVQYKKIYSQLNKKWLRLRTDS